MLAQEAGYLVGFALSGFVATTVLTWIIRQYLVRRSILDVPNERSLHSVPIPRGGGLAIALVLLGATLWLGWAGALSQHIVAALSGGGIMVAAVGWLDDHGDVPARWRFCVQLLAAFWALLWLGGFESANLGFTTLHLGWPLGTLLAALGMVWLTNLYNFMDGTDGIAGVQGVCVGIMGAILLVLRDQSAIATLSLVLAAACGGFLVWNWPPAKVFMGDVGSYLVGFTFAVLAVVSEHTGAVPVLVWIILLSVFIWDTSFTLIRRIVMGEAWYTAHKSHAYQISVQLGLSHRHLLIAVLVLNLAVLWPLAYLAQQYSELLLVSLACSVLLMWYLWIKIQRLFRLSAREGEQQRL